ncbi:MAG: nitrous oxide reductase family maturation protein NosD [Candidatus Bipolaricaulia bacterium]
MIVLPYGGDSVNAYEFTICKDCKHKTIQPAIDAAWSGATVVVGKGVYKANLSIDKSLTLRGAGRGKTIIKPAEKGKPVLSIGSEETKVNIEKLSLSGARAKGEKKEDIYKASGILIAGKKNRVTVKNCSLENNDGWGIYLKGSNELVADKIKASSNKKGGLLVKDDSVVTVSNSALVNNKGSGIFAEGGRIVNLYSNRISGNTRGVHFYSSPQITLKNNLIKNNGSGVLTYMDLFRGEIKGSGNVIKGSVSPPLEWGMKGGFWPENFLSASLTFSTDSEIFPYDDLTLPDGLEFEYVNYDKLLGLERRKLLPNGPEIALVWGKGKIDNIPDPKYDQVTYRPYVLNDRGHLAGIAGKIPKKSHLLSIYFNDGYGWKPAFYLPADESMSSHKEVVKVEVSDLIFSTSGKEVMVIFRPRSPTNPIKRFLLRWTGDRLKVFHRSNYDRYNSSERYDFNTYIRQRPVRTCFQSSLHPAPGSFCYKQYRHWDGDEYEILREELTWWGFDLGADMSGNCRKALREYKEDFKSGLIKYRSDPLRLARRLKGRDDARYWQAFNENGLAIIYRIEGRKKERLFAYQPFYLKEGSEARIWVLTSENLYDKGKATK